MNPKNSISPSICIFERLPIKKKNKKIKETSVNRYLLGASYFFTDNCDSRNITNATQTITKEFSSPP